jgi:phosphoheptose isomerase
MGYLKRVLSAFNTIQIYTTPTEVEILSKHEKKKASMQTIAKTFAAKNIIISCFNGNSYAKLELWNFKLRNKKRATI